MSDDLYNTRGRERKAELLQRYIRLPRWLLERNDISLSAKVLWALIVDRIGAEGLSRSGQARLAKEMGASLSTANRGIRELVKAGLLLAEVPPGTRVGTRGKVGRRQDRCCRYKLPNVVKMTTLDDERGQNDAGNVVKLTTLTWSKCAQNLSSDKPLEPKGSAADAAAPDALTQQAVAAWVETYAEAREGKRPDIDGKAVGVLKRLVARAGSVETLRERLRLAAGLEGPAPWPFDKPGELTLANVGRHWDRLGDALAGGGLNSNPSRVRAPKGKYDRFELDRDIGRIETPPGKYDQFEFGAVRQADTAKPEPGEQASSQTPILSATVNRAKTALELDAERRAWRERRTAWIRDVWAGLDAETRAAVADEVNQSAPFGLASIDAGGTLPDKLGVYAETGIVKALADRGHSYAEQEPSA